MLDNLIQGTQGNFETEVLQAPELVLVDFWASWCGPCKLFDPHLQRLASLYPQRVKVVTINIDEEFDLTQQFQIRSVPTVMLYKDGSFIESKSGLMQYQALEDWIVSRL